MGLWNAHVARLRHEDLIGARICAITASAHAKKGHRFKPRDFMYLHEAATGSSRKEKRLPSGTEILRAFRAMGVKVIDNRNEPAGN